MFAFQIEYLSLAFCRIEIDKEDEKRTRGEEHVLSFVFLHQHNSTQNGPHQDNSYLHFCRAPAHTNRKLNQPRNWRDARVVCWICYGAQKLEKCSQPIGRTARCHCMPNGRWSCGINWVGRGWLQRRGVDGASVQKAKSGGWFVIGLV